MGNKLISQFLIVGIIAVSAVFAYPKAPDLFGREIKINLGLDLQGGVQLLYTIDTSKLEERTLQQAQDEAVDLIRRRVDDLGVSEPNVQPRRVGGEYGIIVELPGIHDIEQAKDIIGKTALLKFYELGEEGGEIETDLTGSDVKRAGVGTDQQTAGFAVMSPTINLEFSGEGAKKFAEITGRNVGKPLITKLDDEIVNQATVKAKIEGGKAVIEGIESLAEAKMTAKLINEGALPAPIKLVQEGYIGATLGRDSIQKSLVAGVIGLILVAIFMLVYYGALGLVAVAALFIYTIIVIAIFKLIPVTLTLAGMAGFIFSIGAAVDANILIFERFKEEKLKNIPIKQALQNGFQRSWSSIRDSNMASIITAAILYQFATGTVKGFAVTLMIGIVVSLFTSITVTRNILRFTVKEKMAGSKIADNAPGGIK